MKILDHSSLEPPLEHNQDQTTFKVCYDILNHLGSYKILCGFRLVLKGKTGEEILESSRLEFLEKFLANNFALSHAVDNTSG